jgi:hypothetical protein
LGSEFILQVKDLTRAGEKSLMGEKNQTKQHGILIHFWSNAGEICK